MTSFEEGNVVFGAGLKINLKRAHSVVQKHIMGETFTFMHQVRIFLKSSEKECSYAKSSQAPGNVKSQTALTYQIRKETVLQVYYLNFRN